MTFLQHKINNTDGVTYSNTGTVLNGTLQKFVTATDGQNRFIQGMIKLGGIVAFTGSLIESFSDEIEFLTDKLLDLLKFGIKQTILILTGPFALAIGSIINNLELFGIQVDFVNKAMSSLANFTIETVDPTNKLSNAIDKAKGDLKEYNEAMEGVNINLDGFGKGTAEASSEMDNLGKSTEKTTEHIRDLNDVLNDIFSRFVSFDISKFVSDLSIAFDAISKKLDQTFNVEKIDRWVDSLKQSFTRATKGVSFEEGVEVPEITFEGSFMGKFEELITKLKIGVGEAFSKAVKVLGKAGSKVGSALSAGISAGAAAAVTGVLAVLAVASKLGQRGSTVAEIEKSVEEDIRARAKAIELGLQALPRILFNVLPPILVEFVDRLIFGLLKGIAEQFNNLINVFKSLFTREGRQERRERRAARTIEGVEEFNQRLNQLLDIAGFRSGGRYLPSARGGIKFTGADEGLAMLHRGEFVVPETGQMPQAVQRTMGMGQGGMTININAAVVESNAVDELVRQIERRFQTFGSSTSPLFGGR